MQKLYGRGGLYIGYLTEDMYYIKAFSVTGKYLGFYNKQSDRTFLQNGTKIAHGNAAASLVYESAN